MKKMILSIAIMAIFLTFPNIAHAEKMTSIVEYDIIFTVIYRCLYFRNENTVAKYRLPNMTTDYL